MPLENFLAQKEELVKKLFYEELVLRSTFKSAQNPVSFRYDVLVVDYHTKHGVKIYRDCLEQICLVMQEIKSKFPDLVSNCNLFDNIEDPEWREKFKANFFKIFIDREQHEYGDEYDKFNSNQFLYGEAFAVSFLSMLLKIYDKFEKQASSEINFEEIFALHKEFFKIVRIKQEDVVVIGVVGSRGCTAYLTYEEAKRRRAIQEKYGKSYILNKNFGIDAIVCFDYGFDHKACLQEYFNEVFLPNSKTDSVSAICNLVAFMGSGVHIASDGNGRIALLLGFFLAISSNQSLPILIHQFVATPEIIAEGVKWNDQFMKDPENSGAPEITMREAGNYALLKTVEDDLCEIFAASVIKFYKKAVKFAVATPLDIDRPIYFEDNGYCLSFVRELRDRDFQCPLIASQDALQDYLRPRDDKELFDFKILKSVLAKNHEIIHAKENLEERFAILAFGFMRKITERSCDYSLPEKNACNIIILSFYHNQAMKENNLSQDFESFVVKYLQNNSEQIAVLKGLFEDHELEMPVSLVNVESFTPLVQSKTIITII